MTFFELGHVGLEIVGMGELLPRFQREFFARVAENFTEPVIHAEPLLCPRRGDRHADERQIEIELEPLLIAAVFLLRKLPSVMSRKKTSAPSSPFQWKGTAATSTGKGVPSIFRYTCSIIGTDILSIFN